MASVLTMESTVGCGHDPGKVATASTAMLTVAGSPVLLSDSIAGKTVSGCKTQQSSSTKPCTTVTAVTDGEATKLTVGGAPVMLSTLVGGTDGNPVGALNASNVQSKLTAA
jgi:hypothetical protein